MRAVLMFPDSVESGHYQELLAAFSARRCRSTKTHDTLWEEVNSWSPLKLRSFLRTVVMTEFAGDVLEMIQLNYDLEEVPLWLVVELLRHRFIARAFSLEQLSQRAISPLKLNVIAPSERLQEVVDEYVRRVGEIATEERLSPEQVREVFPQGVLVNLCVAGSLRSFHHFFFMRSSPLYQGKGGAHVKFMELADSMQAQARQVLPVTMEELLRA